MNKDIKEIMIMEMLEEIDHDIARDYDCELADDPDLAEENMNALIAIVEAHMYKEAK